MGVWQKRVPIDWRETETGCWVAPRAGAWIETNTWDQVSQIRNAKGMSQRQIGVMFGVSRSTIEDVLTRRGWSHNEHGEAVR